ncbi:MAG TPA: MFS transporter [Pseudolysinimonas sp.]|nr:MFS transporter [Pseudolysinimonas sp.]
MSSPPERRRFPRAARPFLHAQYRILSGALILSLFGAGVWLVSMVFEVRELGGGPIELSYVATANALGVILATLVGGAVADRIRQKYILLTVEALKTVAIGAAAALSLTGHIELWHLIVVGLALGLADGFFYPAYSALLPAILPADQLLAANGVEGMLRPTVMQAAGPAVAGLVIGLAAPAWGFALVGVTQLLAVAALFWLRTTAVRRELDDSERSRHPVVGVLVDIGAGWRYMVRTPWLLGTLLFASLLIFVIMGPIEVLLPFVVTDQLGGNAGDFALVLAGFGLGEGIASLVMGSLRLPRRYLTVMVLAWSIGSLPLAIVGFSSSFWLVMAAVFATGVSFAIGQVIWGTLLQRRVPAAMLGRVSSLDFFVSLVFMPVSMAVAGPVGAAIGFGWTFFIAGTAPLLIGVIAIVAARMPRDEIAHPLEDGPIHVDTGGVPTIVK